MTSTHEASVTVLIPTYNRSQFLQQTLDSIFQQSLVPSQVLVVDDGSTDETQAVVARNPRVTYLHKLNGGKSSAINLALPHVSGDFLWIFDDDDVAERDALERLVGAILANPGCGFSYGTYSMHPDVCGAIGPEVARSEIPPFAANAPLAALMEACYLGSATVLARTNVYHELGGFDERFRRSQDYHVVLKMAARYDSARVAGGPIFRRRVHANVRGASGYHVRADEVWRNHLEYDATILRELCKELTLDRLLPSGHTLETNFRQALLQRMSVLVIHRVYPEAIAAIQEIAALAAAGPYSGPERDILSRLIMHTNGLATGDLRLSAALVELRDMPEIRRMRRRLVMGVLRRALNQWRDPARAGRTVWRATWLSSLGLSMAARRMGVDDEAT